MHRSWNTAVHQENNPRRSTSLGHDLRPLEQPHLSNTGILRKYGSGADYRPNDVVIDKSTYSTREQTVTEADKQPRNNCGFSWSKRPAWATAGPVASLCRSGLREQVLVHPGAGGARGGLRRSPEGWKPMVYPRMVRPGLRGRKSPRERTTFQKEGEERSPWESGGLGMEPAPLPGASLR